MIRNTVRALIVQDDHLLSIKKERPGIGVYYALPGGAQEPDETLEQALYRECIEELGVSIVESKLLCIREYISYNHEYSFIMKEVHSLDFIYLCKTEPIHTDLNSIQADIGQIGIEWLPISKIRESLIQDDESMRMYKFPRTLHDFYIEYFLTEKVELCKSIRF
ncbi:NUDIX domain-containing protein [Paenibacillus radicis (ex Xue et al. 2023)]|uniref:NUDIX domain-containing protein n=1 Tax=Paenibacillus radicis (ex Xue et al. 2023) TaxID=2972489 RepID=A0ABT1YBD8_9BACL|nr:NUDIX domain-containing protein [Paenibacillus radicis (ex Xue et al. 2023)]MCR8630497.1 NUDIX domain-containing protein [Paenibacillus radicis (ex Xue et al. 2023)]